MSNETELKTSDKCPECGAIGLHYCIGKKGAALVEDIVEGYDFQKKIDKQAATIKTLTEALKDVQPFARAMAESEEFVHGTDSPIVSSRERLNKINNALALVEQEGE